MVAPAVNYERTQMNTENASPLSFSSFIVILSGAKNLSLV